MIKLDGYKLFVKRVGLLGITNILVVLTSLILTPILTKTLPITDYGLWVQVNTTYLLITGFNALGLPYTMVRFLSSEKDKIKIQETFYSLVTLILIVSSITSLTLFYFSKPISEILFNGNAGVVIIASLIIFFGSLNLFFIDYFRAFGRMKIYSSLLIIQAYLTLGLVSYFTVLRKGILVIVSALLITQLVIALITIPIIIRSIGFKVPKFSNIKQYLNFGLPTIPNSLAYWMVDSSDRYFIAFLLGAAFVGYYSPGYILGTMIFLFVTPLSLILAAVLPKYYDNGKFEDVDLIIRYSLKYFLLVAIPSVFALSILSKPILVLLTTPEIAANGYLITPFVALSALLIGIYGITTNYLLLKKKTKLLGLIWIIAAIVSFLNIIFIPHFGIIGAGAVTLISYTVAFILGLYYTLKDFKINFDYIFILKSLSAAILMSIFIILINPKGLLDVILVIAASTAIYFILIYILKGIKQDEIDFLKNMIQ